MPRARFGDIELEYETIGQGRPLVLIMGLGGQLVMWDDAFCEQLAARGFAVTRFDNRDTGLSTRLNHLRVPSVRRLFARAVLGRPVSPPYTLSTMAADVVGLLEELGVEAAHIVGASLGGMVAQTLAVEHPARVLSLTSIMSHPGDLLSRLPRPRAIRALMQPAPSTREQTQAAHLAFFSAVGSRGLELDTEGIRRRAGQHFDRGPSPWGFLRQLAAVLAAPDRRPGLRQLDLPALVIHGTDDALIPAGAAHRTARAIPGAALRIIEGMGHDFPLRAWPQIFDAIADVAAARP